MSQTTASLATAAPAATPSLNLPPDPYGVTTLDTIKVALNSQEPTVPAAVTYIKDSIKNTIRSNPGASTANLSAADARTLLAVAAWLEDALLTASHNPATSALEQRITILTKSVERNSTEVAKLRASVAPPPPPPIQPDDEEEESAVAAALGAAPTSSSPTWAAVARRRRTVPLKLPLDQRLEPTETLLKRTGIEDTVFFALSPADKVLKLRSSLMSALSSDGASSDPPADPTKLIRAIRPLPSGDMIVISASAANTALLKSRVTDWLPQATSALTTHVPTWGVVIHRVPTSFTPDQAASKAALRIGNEDLLPEAFSASWLRSSGAPSSQPIKKHGSLLISLSSAAQANLLIQNGVAYDGRILRVERAMRNPPQCWRCQRFGHVSHQCKQAPRCGICSGAHLTNACSCPSEDKCEATDVCTHVTHRCANCGLAHKAKDALCAERKRAYDAHKARALGAQELYPLTTNSSHS